MKNYFCALGAVVLLALIIVFPVNSHAGWELYDDFSSDVIDTELWNISDTSATISVEDGWVRFEHHPGHGELSSWLSVNENPEDIRGLKAKVTMESCSGDVRGRIGWFVGKLGDNYVMSQLAVQANSVAWWVGKLWGRLTVMEPSFNFLYDPFWGYFENPRETIGDTFTFSIRFSKKKVTYEVSDLGEITFNLPQKMSKTDFFFGGIGTKSWEGDGPCVVYFDDVYVLR